MLYYKKSIYRRRKYVSKRSKVDNKIISFLDESLEEIRTFYKMKRAPINKYINSIYEYYCGKAGLDFENLINNKNTFKLMITFVKFWI